MLLIDLSPLRNLEFRRLFLSQLISMFGTQMTMVTIPFQVYAMTQSTFQTGLISSIELVCLLLTVFWGGALADSLDRRKMLVLSECAMAFFIALLGINASLAEPSLVLIYALAGLTAAIGGFHRPAFEALTPLLVRKDELAKVSALTMLKSVLASLVGPSLAGMLLASLGPVATYGVDVASFVVSLIFLLKIKTPLTALASGKPSSVVKEVVAGAAYLKSRKDILGSYVVDFFAMVFCMPQVLFPAFAASYGQSRWLGLLYSAVAAGAALASVVSGWTSKVNRLGYAIALSAGGWALAIMLAGLIPGFWLIPGSLFLAGLCDGFSGIFRTTMWNESIPAQFRGRLASFNMVSYMSGPLLGNTVMGFLASKLGLHGALTTGGIVSLSLVVLVSCLLPAFRAYESSAMRHVNDEPTL